MRKLECKHYFHFQTTCRKCRRFRIQSLCQHMAEAECPCNDGAPIFYPPVYRQRYDFVEKTVREFGAKKVIDFGCAEGKLISQLKCVECVEELVGIDIDLKTLEFSKGRTRPFSADYLDPRSKPLTVSLYQGSIAVCDERFVNFDLVACVEIIEHLHPPVLNAMPDVIFGHMQPKVVVVTTPNSEFNVLFPGLKGFRHYDHKFEWTRAEFESWGIQVSSRFGYSVSFTGVGDGPAGTEHLGKCSQIALFLRNKEHNESGHLICEGQCPYAKVISSVHPFKKQRSVEELLVEELEYYTLYLASDYKDEEDSHHSEIPVERFLDFPRISKLTSDVEVLRSVIDGSSTLQLNESRSAVVYTRDHDEWPSEDEDDDGRCNKWDSEGVGCCYDQYYKLDCPTTEECWDTEMECENVGSCGCGEDRWSSWREKTEVEDGDSKEREVDILADHDFMCN